jgi:uncharacterized cupin superfamily protein
MPPAVHWDEVEKERSDEGAFRSAWSVLGEAAGSVTVNVNRIEVEPGARSTPLHMENAEEEIFFVLGGSGLSWQQNRGQPEQTFEIRPGDCLVHRAGAEAHSLVAGADGLDVLAFGDRSRAKLAFFPRLKGGRLGPLWTEELPKHQWQMELELGEPELPPSPRPPRIVNVDEVEAEEWSRGDSGGVDRELGAAAGSVRAGLNHSVVPAGTLNGPPHCHSAEEELFVVLDGTGTLLLGDEEHPVRRGSVVSRPAGTRVAHAFRGGDDGLTLLAYGTREANDICYYPRSNKIYWRGVGLIARLERLDYWDGEEG